MKVALVLLALVLLQGCNSEPNILKGISLEAGQTLALGTPIKFVLSGTGKCDSLNIDWGDGERTLGTSADLSGTDSWAFRSRTRDHRFEHWGGGKTVTVEAIRGCEGKVNLRFNVPPFERQLAFAQPGRGPVCEMVAFTRLPPMIPRMLVHIRTTALAPPNHRGINFGCFAAGCVYDADGKPGTVAAWPFPFPGMREYSLVLRIGSQLAQGGTNTQFTTTASGTLEFCLNDGDNNVTNNLGGFTIHLSVDQLGP